MWCGLAEESHLGEDGGSGREGQEGGGQERVGGMNGGGWDMAKNRKTGR